jgi:hypothetical protein
MYAATHAPRTDPGAISYARFRQMYAATHAPRTDPGAISFSAPR